MLPPGHIVAGYLVTAALLKFMHAQFTPHEYHQLLALGAFFGFAPDLDAFYAFFKVKAFIITDPSANHRTFYSHTPVLWLIAGLLIFIFSKSSFFQYVGLLVWLASWSHFLLDSIEDGIMWLWPFTTKRYAVFKKEFPIDNSRTGFVSYLLRLIKMYSTKISFYLEIAILVVGIITFLK